MKYCLNYVKGKNTSALKKTDEINITYSSKDADFYQFLKLHANKRINLFLAFGEESEYEDFKNSDVLETLGKIKKEYPELAFYLKLQGKNIRDKELIDKIKEQNIPFYTDIFVKDWDTFNGLLSLGVSDIYIVEDMCFQLNVCTPKAHEQGVKLRTFPNIAQSSWYATSALKKFFIRPEDVVQYESYIDTLEFITNENAIHQEEVLYEIYAEKKVWFGKLNEIIIDLNDDTLDSRYIVPRFAENRIRCGKKCMKNPDSCKICEAVYELSLTLKEKNIIVTNKTEL